MQQSQQYGKTTFRKIRKSCETSEATETPNASGRLKHVIFIFTILLAFKILQSPSKSCLCCCSLVKSSSILMPAWRRFFAYARNTWFWNIAWNVMRTCVAFLLPTDTLPIRSVWLYWKSGDAGMLEGRGKLGCDRTCDNISSGASGAVRQALAAAGDRRPCEPRTRRVSSAACSTRTEVGSNPLGSTVSTLQEAQAAYLLVYAGPLTRFQSHVPV